MTSTAGLTIACAFLALLFLYLGERDARRTLAKRVDRLEELDNLRRRGLIE